MRVFLVVCVALVLATIATADPATVGSPAQLAPTFAIDLDAPAETRWVAVTSAFKDQYGGVMAWIDKVFPPALQRLLDPLLAKLGAVLPADFYNELKGVSAGSGIDLGLIVILNVIYDVSAACTSIVAQNTNGTIMHARNLDYPIAALQNITIQALFQKGGVTLAECTTFAGYVGCLTGMRPGAWSVSVNQRMQPGSSIIQNIMEALKGGKSIGYFLREALISQSAYPMALDLLSTEPLMAPVYLTVAGVNPGEGAVITRNRTVADDVWPLDAEEGRWFVLQTNDDHWKPAEDGRRAAGNKGMNALGPDNVSLQGMFNVLSTPPVFQTITRYTAQIDPLASSYTSWVRYDAPTFDEEVLYPYSLWKDGIPPDTYWYDARQA